MLELPTKTGRSKFRYERDSDGTICIQYGANKSVARISAMQFDKLLAEFRGRCVPLGSSRDMARPESLGAWLKANITPTAIASYVGPILVYEGLVAWGEGDEICIKG